MEQINKQEIYWTSFIHDEWKMFIAATGKGLCYVGSPNKPFEELVGWATKRFLDYTLVQNESKLQPYITEFEAYFEGKHNPFIQPTDLKGTPFQLSIWNALNDIPYGETYSYTQIAEMIGNPKAVRAVGAAIGANPVLITVPCHRVLAKSGALTGFRAGLEMKEYLLHLEKREETN